MELGFCSISALDRPLVAAAQLAVVQGLDGIEVSAHPPHLEPETPLEAVRAAGREIESVGARALSYGSYLGRFGSRTREAALREVAVAAALRAPRIRVWAEPEETAGDDDFASSVKLLQTTCDAAAAEGIEVVVERHVGSFADSPERVERLLDAVGRPNFALNYQVLDNLPETELEAQPADARRLVPRARYFHLKNYRFPREPGGPVLPGGSLEGGVLDYRAILAEAFGAGYTGPLAIEFLSFEPGLSTEEKLAADVAWLRGVLKDLGVDA
jgi:sugar phosphate isomerase/epimerase